MEQEGKRGNMSILIKGMEMPGNCCACFAAGIDGSCRITREKPTFEEWYEQRSADCPLVTVPDHGRLIDADALYRKCGSFSHDDLRIVPTIIPAEEGET